MCHNINYKKKKLKLQKCRHKSIFQSIYKLEHKQGQGVGGGGNLQPLPMAMVLDQYKKATHSTNGLNFSTLYIYIYISFLSNR